MQFIPSDDGITIAAETFGNGPPLIFAHGLTSHHRMTRLEMEPLAGRHRVILFDQRGHGASTPVTNAALYTPERMAGDLRAVLDALGIEQAIVGGESMGAATALAFALAHPQRVAALLLTAPAFGDSPNPDSQRMLDMGKSLAQLGMAEFLSVAAVRQRTQFNWAPELVRFVAELFSAHEADSLATALQTVPRWLPLPDMAPLAQFQPPTCIVAWDGDPVHPIELARRMAAALPNATLQTMAPLPALFLDPPEVGRRYARYLETL
jgi:pimeloyl-ACP methyl ester carboxylesterase